MIFIESMTMKQFDDPIPFVGRDDDDEGQRCAKLVGKYESLVLKFTRDLSVTA